MNANQLYGKLRVLLIFIISNTFYIIKKHADNFNFFFIV